MISEKDYCELEKRFLKLKNDYDNSYSNHIDIERSLNKSYNDALNDRNKCKFEFYDLKEKYDPSGRLNMSMLYNELPKTEQKKFDELKKATDEDKSSQLNTKFEKNGDLISGDFLPFTIDTLGMPHPDQKGTAISMINKLSKTDFENNSVKLGPSGSIILPVR